MVDCEKCLHEAVCDQASRQRVAVMAGETECSDFKNQADWLPVSRDVQACLSGIRRRRMLILTDKQVLALKAVAYGCNKNKRLAGATYISDIHSARTQDISFYEALTMVYAILDELEGSLDENL